MEQEAPFDEFRREAERLIADLEYRDAAHREIRAAQRQVEQDARARRRDG